MVEKEEDIMSSHVTRGYLYWRGYIVLGPLEIRECVLILLVETIMIMGLNPVITVAYTASNYIGSRS